MYFIKEVLRKFVSLCILLNNCEFILFIRKFAVFVWFIRRKTRKCSKFVYFIKELDSQ